MYTGYLYDRAHVLNAIRTAVRKRAFSNVCFPVQTWAGNDGAKFQLFQALLRTVGAMAAHDQRRATAAEAAAAEAAAAKAAQAARAAAATVAPLEATLQEEIKRELFPERSENGKASQVGKQQERKGCCDILMFGQVSICFNLQFRDDITM